MTLKNNNARNEAGADVTELGGGVTQQRKILHCSYKHIKSILNELSRAGLALSGVNTLTQRAVLLKTLQYLGPRGLNTYEGTAAGYARLATRIQELEEDWIIASQRETVIGPDGLVHPGIARYVLVGLRKDAINPQGALDLEVPA
ncbi:hypothetical protein [Noviherbaspirillum autotrophicum]|uniref:Uncharacterized protein n=1 Tax=Noviherbaspirillum autotrophicum TaxID=709839 RepID=A0A0C2BRK8_9BURK|nr:hypothetical protein [Noviherbaspirillum autotrophicum]KIF80711.1 hypothetical protein TSA66_07635 [Noviherbaspirillum autotrophicum]